MYFGHLRKVIGYVELIIQQKLLLMDSTIRNIIILAHDHETNKCHDEPNTIEIKKNMKHITN
jgi:ABC-type multidrug transport system fused ATPase/permease subunit